MLATHKRCERGHHQSQLTSPPTSSNLKDVLHIFHSDSLCASSCSYSKLREMQKFVSILVVLRPIHSADPRQLPRIRMRPIRYEDCHSGRQGLVMWVVVVVVVFD